MAIYDSIGGAGAVSAVVDIFYDNVLSDPSLAPYFDGVSLARLKGHQRSFIAAALGGPEAYAGRSMAEAHAGLGVTPEAFGKVVGHLVQALEIAGVDHDTIAEIGSNLAPLEADIVSHQTTS